MIFSFLLSHTSVRKLTGPAIGVGWGAMNKKKNLYEFIRNGSQASL